MGNFKLIYKILSYISDSMQYEEFDEEHFTAAYFGISNPLFINLLKMLVKITLRGFVLLRTNVALILY